MSKFKVHRYARAVLTYCLVFVLICIGGAIWSAVIGDKVMTGITGLGAVVMAGLAIYIYRDQKDAPIDDDL